MNTDHKSRGNGITKIIGSVLIIFGAIIILEDYYYFYFDFWDFWPVILIVIGIKKITDNSKDYIFGGLIIAAGLFFLGNNLNLLPYFLEDNFFAFLLIIIGVFIISQKSSFNHNRDEILSDDYIRINAIFGGNERVIDSKDFSGGDCTAIFGSIDIDFRRADLKDGGQPVYLNIIFGGVTLYVPDEWNVIFESTTIFGSNEDNRKFRNEMEKDAGKNLIVKGLCIFGGIEIKS